MHRPEPDEDGVLSGVGEGKDHIHLIIEPAKMIQTEDINDYMMEIVPGESKARGCLPFRASKFSDWYLYAVHDAVYLASKGQGRYFVYLKEDIKTSSIDYLDVRIKEIQTGDQSKYMDMNRSIAEGDDFAKYLVTREVPIQQIAGYEKAWFLLKSFYRGKGEKHSPREILTPSLEAKKHIEELEKN